MFTGLIKEIGTVAEIKNNGESLKIKIRASEVIKNAKIGDSIATNGVCLTAVEVGGDYFTADAMPETYRRANLKRLKSGDKVNLENSITMSTPLDGHMVTGDVDCEGTIKSIHPDGIAKVYEIEVEEKYAKYIVEKGRISVDGASLTVAGVSGKVFKVSLIPHTQKNITLGSKYAGDIVNIETDITGKYIEKFFLHYMGGEEKSIKSNIDMKFLLENGFA